MPTRRLAGLAHGRKELGGVVWCIPVSGGGGHDDDCVWPLLLERIEAHLITGQRLPKPGMSGSSTHKRLGCDNAPRLLLVVQHGMANAGSCASN